MFTHPLFNRLRWIHIPSALLVTLLQRTPVLRLLVTAEESLTAPAASILRSALLPAAALGAVHSLAGATNLVVNPKSPASATGGSSFQMAIAVSGSGVSTANSWTVENKLPPGLSVSGGSVNGNLIEISFTTASALTIIGTPTTAGSYTFSVTGYEFGSFTGPQTTGSVTINVTGGSTATAPAITTQPSAQTVVVGSNVTFSVAASGSPSPSYIWQKNGSTVSGANSSTLTLNNVKTSDAGSFTAVATNSVGSAVSSPAVLTVQTPVAPTISSQPQNQALLVGGSTTLSLSATGIPTPTYQWQFNGVVLPSVTGSTLALTNVQTTDAGAYKVIVSNSAGSMSSQVATVTVSAAGGAPVFSLQPLSQTVASFSTAVLTASASSPTSGSGNVSFQWYKNGTAIGNGTSPTLTLSSLILSDSGNYYAVAKNSLGSTTSSTAAILVATPTAGSVTNFSVQALAGTGSQTLVTGFVISGNVPKQVLIRALGPTLAALAGTTGTLNDPVLKVYGSAGLLATNDNWGDAPNDTNSLSATFVTVGATPLVAGSKDSAVLLTLVPGTYTVEVTSANGTDSGIVYLDVFQVQ